VNGVHVRSLVVFVFDFALAVSAAISSQRRQLRGVAKALREGINKLGEEARVCARVIRLALDTAMTPFNDSNM
jgi:hypothetical protein